MQPNEHLEQLLSALETREIPITRNDVQWAFDSQLARESVVEWITHNLRQETFLSQHEYQLYALLS
jgi:hypothetical protein